MNENASGRGLQGRGRGFDKGAIGFPTVPQGAERSHPFRLIPTSYGFVICCHGRGQ
jgi:hypothetical protein